MKPVKQDSQEGSAESVMPVTALIDHSGDTRLERFARVPRSIEDFGNGELWSRYRLQQTTFHESHIRSDQVNRHMFSLMQTKTSSSTPWHALVLAH